MLELKNISKSFEGKAVLRDLNLTIADSECVCVTGPSGCGKTTLLRIAAGLDKADSGECFIKGTARLSILFQENRLLPWETALGNITAVGVDEKRAMQYLSYVSLDGESETFPAQLSGGMKRRLSLARALAYGGDFYLFDEPLLGLDEALQLSVLALIRREIEGRAALVISHNPTVPELLGARVFPLSANEQPRAD